MKFDLLTLNRDSLITGCTESAKRENLKSSIYRNFYSLT